MEYLKIIQGTDRTVNLILKNSDKTPFDLTGATSIKAIFLKQDDTENLLEVSGGNIEVVGDASRGEISIDLESAITLQMRAGERLKWELEVTIAASMTYVAQFPESLDVLARLSAG